MPSPLKKSSISFYPIACIFFFDHLTEIIDTHRIKRDERVKRHQRMAKKNVRVQGVANP
jgi:hypothetical protein